LPEQYAHVVGLKKKEKQNSGSKRKKTWIDKLTKKKKKKSNKKKKSKHVRHEEGVPRPRTVREAYGTGYALSCAT